MNLALLLACTFTIERGSITHFCTGCGRAVNLHPIMVIRIVTTALQIQAPTRFMDHGTTPILNFLLSFEFGRLSLELDSNFVLSIPQNTR